MTGGFAPANPHCGHFTAHGNYRFHLNGHIGYAEAEGSLTLEAAQGRTS